MDDNVKQMDFNAGDNQKGKYNLKAIWDSAVYTRKSELYHLVEYYYLVFCKDYAKDENIWKPYSAV